MKPFLIALVALGMPVPEPAGLSPAAQKQIEARRAALQELQGISRESLSPERLAELDRRLQPQLDQLAAALAHRDPFIYDEAVRDLVNGNYRAFPPDKIYPLLLPLLRKPETNAVRIDAQAWVMRYLSVPSRRIGSKAAVPDLLRMLGDDKVATYLRGQAIDAAARIAPGDPAVVKAFIAALENPNPTDTSGVHDCLAERLGEMGKAAAPAKKALIKLFERDSFYQDPAYIALGKIDGEKPRALAVYLNRLGKLDALPVEQGAAAFLHIVELGRTGPPDNRAIVPEVARAARPVLLAVVAGRPNDVHSRAALRAVADLGAGSSPATAKVLVGALLKYHEALAAGRKALAAVAPGPAREAQSRKIFQEVYSYNRDNLVLTALDRLEPTERDAAGPIAEAFAHFVSQPEDWVVAQRLAKNLTRFGTAARPAVPTVIKALRALPLRTRQDVSRELFVDYLAILAAAGGDAPGARRAVLDHLDPGGPTLTKTGPNAVELRLPLLLTLAKLGLPADGGERTMALGRVREGLASDRVEIFSAATKVVAATPTLTPEEAGPVVKALGRVLAKDFRFPPAPGDIPRHLVGGFTYEEERLLGCGLALRALGSLGPLARAALPGVRALAKQEFQKRTSGYLPDPPINGVIREARKAEKQLEGKR